MCHSRFDKSVIPGLDPGIYIKRLINYNTPFPGMEL